MKVYRQLHIVLCDMDAYPPSKFSRRILSVVERKLHVKIVRFLPKQEPNCSVFSRKETVTFMCLYPENSIHGHF